MVSACLLKVSLASIMADGEFRHTIDGARTLGAQTVPKGMEMLSGSTGDIVRPEGRFSSGH